MTLNSTTNNASNTSIDDSDFYGMKDVRALSYYLAFFLLVLLSLIKGMNAISRVSLFAIISIGAALLYVIYEDF